MKNIILSAILPLIVDCPISFFNDMGREIISNMTETEYEFIYPIIKDCEVKYITTTNDGEVLIHLRI